MKRLSVLALVLALTASVRDAVQGAIRRATVPA